MTTETSPQVKMIAYGTLDAVRAEYGLLEMGDDWFKENKIRYVVKILGDAEWDVSFCETIKEARTEAKYLAEELDVPFYCVG